ncbi:hypothetical protein ACFSM7_03170 [Clavibacter michiganensis subsp. tessellarius]|uniref:hypothetical protein n=1 Tax=Clavibacter tessellarius TaxID=31965 RepID=UPI003640D8D9
MSHAPSLAVRAVPAGDRSPCRTDDGPADPSRDRPGRRRGAAGQRPERRLL